MKYVFAFTVGAPGQGSAIAVLERRPRKGAKRERRLGDNVFVEQEWIDDHAVTHLERVPPSESVPQCAQRVRAMLTTEPLVRDADFVLDVTTYGRGLMDMFYSLEPAPPQYRIAIGGETEAANPTCGGWTLPLRDVRGALLLHVQEGRLKIAEGLALGPPLLRSLENPEATPDADVYLATALAVWLGRRCQTHGPWSSNKPPAYGSPAWHELDMIRMQEADERRQRERREETSWRRGYGFGGNGWDE